VTIDPRDRPCRYSALKQFARSPLHYWHAMQDGFVSTRAMTLGSGGHAMLFGTPFVVYEGQRRGNDWKAFQAEHVDTLILNEKEAAEARAMVDAVRGSALAMSVLFGPDMRYEQRIDWTWNGRAYRSTPDAYSPTRIVDLKTTQDAEPGRVAWQSSKMHYHAQAALYREAIQATHPGARIEDCYLVVVESKAPHPVTVLRFSDAALMAGLQSCIAWDRQRADCEERNAYPSYAQTVVPLDLPGTDSLVWPEGDDITTNSNEAA
jgi:hypothetical protein